MSQVLIVSNRLPVNVKKVDGKLQYSTSIGGLATGLASYVQNRRSKWIGWPGIASDELTETDKQKIVRRLARDNYYPVFLTQKQIDDFYNGYSNQLLWPLFHGLPFSDSNDHKKWWKVYQEINDLFAQTTLRLASTKSQVWVHDYQLLLMPELLRVQRPELSIGFFLHIPFPTAKNFAQFPESKKLLQGMLGADLVGFHTENYVKDFIANCREAHLGIVEENHIVFPLRTVRVTDFPMGIDYDKFAAASKLPGVKRAVRRYRKKYKGMKIIAAVDRLDISKGFVERLTAYRDFLEQNKKLRGKVVFVLVGAPSRTDIDIYQKLGARVDKLAREINEMYGTKKWQPVDYINYTIPFEEVSALFQIAHVAFIAPLKDGMNLAAKEFVASSRSQGVLILSKTAGAAQELSDALLVNPRRRETSVKALQQALTMPPRELHTRLKNMQAKIAGNTVHDWAGNFVDALQQPVPHTPAITHVLTIRTREQLAIHYQHARKRLLLLDYDGSLVPLSDNYKAVKPSKELVEILKKLAADQANEIVIISGRKAEDLEKWFGQLPVSLVAEHGATVRTPGKKGWQLAYATGTTWKAEVITTLEKYIPLTPRASIEIKNYSVVWHYRQSPPYYAQKYAVVIKRDLKRVLKKYGLEIRQGNKVLEIKSPSITKGITSKSWLRKRPDFILAIGDDFTDEDMFETLPPNAYSVKVGSGRTKARLRVRDPEATLRLLSSFVE